MRVNMVNPSNPNREKLVSFYDELPDIKTRRPDWRKRRQYNDIRSYEFGRVSEAGREM